MHPVGISLLIGAPGLSHTECSMQANLLAEAVGECFSESFAINLACEEHLNTASVLAVAGNLDQCNAIAAGVGVAATEYVIM